MRKDTFGLMEMKKLQNNANTKEYDIITKNKMTNQLEEGDDINDNKNLAESEGTSINHKNGPIILEMFDPVIERLED